MATKTRKNGAFSVTAFQGDAKTLLAFNLDRKSARNLAGFTFRVTPGNGEPYYLVNNLQFKEPAKHVQDPSLPPNSSLNAPFHRFRWLHVPGQSHQGLDPFLGPYTYTVTPRFFDADRAMTALDPSRSASLTIDVVPFRKRALAVGFTRGFVQSQAFVRHFGRDATIRPAGDELLFDASVASGVNARGDAFTGEAANGDNLLAIRDGDVATVFAIEALGLVDHFDFLDRSAVGKEPDPSKVDAALKAEWYLSTSGKWADPYYDPDDLRFADRRLFS